MDPNEALKRLRELAADTQNTNNVSVAANLAIEIAELFQDLDTWIIRGGFLPRAWERQQ